MNPTPSSILDFLQKIASTLNSYISLIPNIVRIFQGKPLSQASSSIPTSINESLNNKGSFDEEAL